jgi:nitroreductase
MLNLTTDALLTTTRSVRKRLDLTRSVERSVIEECLTLAQQAPSEGNSQRTHFVIVTDPARRAALAECYRRGWAIYRNLPTSRPKLTVEDPILDSARVRIIDSARYLVRHLAEVPALVVPCVTPRTEGLPPAVGAALWGTVAPATWSFMLAARSRGLGTCWTSLHLFFEEEAAATLGIPYSEVMQIALIPVAYTIGTDFMPAARLPLNEVAHWDTW